MADEKPTKKGLGFGDGLLAVAVVAGLAYSVPGRIERSRAAENEPRSLFAGCVDTLTRDPSALTEGVRLYERRLGADEARDLASDTLVKVCLKAEAQRDVRAVFFTALKNSVIDEWRRQKREAGRWAALQLVPTVGGGPTLQAMFPACPVESADPLDAIESTEMQALVSSYVRELTDEDRSLFLLRVEYGMTFQEIAARLESKKSTVHDRWNRLEAELRRRLGACVPTREKRHGY